MLSGDVDYVRVRRAADLFHSGSVRQIVFTGAGFGGDNASSLQAIALDLGVPKPAMAIEDRSTTTRDNLAFAAPVIRRQGWRRVALITSASHMARSERVARKLLPEVEWVPVPVEDPGPPSRLYSQRLQEWAKLIWYLARGWA